MIKKRLEALSTIGQVTVSASAASAAAGCVWTVTFDSNAGASTFPSIEVSGTSDNGATWDAFSNAGTFDDVSQDTFTVTDSVAGTSAPLGGSFTLEFDGQRTGYLSYDSDAATIEAALDALSTIGDVDVTRSTSDENGGYTWSITFLSNLGALPTLISDDNDITGTAASVTVATLTPGQSPPFNSDEYNSITVTDLSDLSATASDLRQGIPYYFRVSAMNAIGTGPATVAFPPYSLPTPQVPSTPTDVLLSVVDGSTLSVQFDTPALTGGEPIDTYQVEYSTDAFVDEIQVSKNDNSTLRFFANTASRSDATPAYPKACSSNIICGCPCGVFERLARSAGFLGLGNASFAVTLTHYRSLSLNHFPSIGTGYDD